MYLVNSIVFKDQKIFGTPVCYPRNLDKFRAYDKLMPNCVEL